MLTESEFNRQFVLLTDSNKITRQKALQALCNDLKSETTDDFSRFSGSNFQIVLKIFADVAEKNRDLALSYVSIFVERSCQDLSNLEKILPNLMPAIVQRLATNEIVEPSEEIRLKMVELLLKICRGKQTSLYLNEWTGILKKTIVDPYPEVRKLSCELTLILSKETREKFHFVSENLVKPIIETMKHQHAKVRIEAVRALGNVLLYGNNKSIEEIVSPLAQRFFDHTSSVRLAVINVVGIWMLELKDRYSYFHLMLPLLLTGYTDEIEEIRQTTDSLWWDVGLKYEKENEEDLKDQINFPQTPNKYPPNLTRPNLGCRELVKRNLIRILPAIRNDLTDWVASGRVKSSQLLAVLTWQAEDTITQHIEDTLLVCSKALIDDEPIVRDQVLQALTNIGYFVPVKIWFRFVHSHIEQNPTLSLLRLIAPLLQGTDREELLQNETLFDQLLSIILKSDYTENLQLSIQVELQRICQLLIEKCQEDLQGYAYRIFKCLLSLLSIVEKEELKQQCHKTLLDLAKSFCQNKSVEELYENFAPILLKELKETSKDWLRSSRDRFLFETLILQSGTSNEKFFEEILEILQIVLQIDRDAELRNQSLLIVANLLGFLDQVQAEKSRFGKDLSVLIDRCILPNMQWKPGRTAAALRATAIATLWSLFQAKTFSFDQCSSSMNEVLTAVLGMLDDDDRLTRTNSCFVLESLFSNDDAIRSIDNERLHKAYPDLLKRLDDVVDEIRLAMCSTLNAYIRSFHSDFNVSLYRSHLEDISKTLLIHMDDQNSTIQQTIYDTIYRFATELKDAADTFLNEIRQVKHKHRNQALCDKLIEQIEQFQSNLV